MITKIIIYIPFEMPIIRLSNDHEIYYIYIQTNPVCTKDS